MYHNGPENNSVFQSITIAMNGRAHSALIWWELGYPRLSVAQFRITSYDKTAISIQAPTLQPEPSAQGAFYTEFRGLVNRVPRRDIFLTAGGRSVRTGLANEYTHKILRKFILRERCENGGR